MQNEVESNCDTYLYTFLQNVGCKRTNTLTSKQITACAGKKSYTPSCKKIAGDIMMNDYMAVSYTVEKVEQNKYAPLAQLVRVTDSYSVG